MSRWCRCRRDWLRRKNCGGPGLYRWCSRRLMRMCCISARRCCFERGWRNSWRAISLDLTREDPEYQQIWMRQRWRTLPGKAARRDLHDCAVERAGWRNLGRARMMAIQLTRDEGKTWSNVTPAELTPWSKVTLIEVRF